MGESVKLLRSLAVAALSAGVLAAPGTSWGVSSPFGPDDASPGCVTRDEFNAVKPVDRAHFAPYVLRRTEVNGWFDASPKRVEKFSGGNVGGVFSGGVERIQTYRACYGIPRFGEPRGTVVVVVEYHRAPLLRQSGYPGFRSTDVYTF